MVAGSIPNNLVTPNVSLQTDLKLSAKIKETWIIVETGSITNIRITYQAKILRRKTQESVF